MLRRPKHSKIEVVAPKEEEDVFFSFCWVLGVPSIYGVTTDMVYK
jgi:hypothetical protein